MVHLWLVVEIELVQCFSCSCCLLGEDEAGGVVCVLHERIIIRGGENERKA